MARILVHLDTKEGLEERMTLRWGNFSRTQNLDYEGVPFRCNRCHHVGHLFKDCPLNISQDGSPKPAQTVSSRVPPIVPRSPRNSAPPTVPRSPRNSAKPRGVPAKGHEYQNVSPSPPLTRARAAAAAAKVSGTSPTPLSISSDVSNVHENSFAFTMVQCVIPPPPPSTSTASPSLHFSSPPPSPHSSRSSSSHPYSLRPRTSRPEASESITGLGIVPLDPGFPSSQGRKSNLNKAIRLAGAEVAAGRQATIVGVLRATNPPNIGPP